MIELKNITKTYNLHKSNSFCALKDVNLTIEEGEFVAIVGKSGAGKSTLLHLIGCIDECEKGEIYIDGEKVSSFDDGGMAKIRNEKIGIVLQNYALINSFTVGENVEIPLIFSQKKKKERKILIREALRKTGILELENCLVSELSGGQQQRVAIARALVNNPKYILADEPTGALDKSTGKKIISLLCDLNKEGITVVIITHDNDIASKCSRIISICDGVIST